MNSGRDTPKGQTIRITKTFDHPSHITRREKVKNKKDNEDNEIEQTIHGIMCACGSMTNKDKVTILYLTIDRIFKNNPELSPKMDDVLTIH